MKPTEWAAVALAVVAFSSSVFTWWSGERKLEREALVVAEGHLREQGYIVKWAECEARH